MRWILFDLVVGAALVWLVWDGRTAEQPAAEVRAMAAVRSPPMPIEPEPPAEAVGAPATPMTVTPVAARVEAATVEAAPLPLTPSPTVDRGQRLRALARDVEAMFLRGRE